MREKVQHAHVSGYPSQVSRSLSGANKIPEGKIVSDRLMGNMLEQAIPLIACLWMYGFYIDSARATSLGLVYVGVRALYPVLYAKWGRMTIGVEFCTQPM